MDYFARYPSNISLGTSNNTIFKPDKTGCYTYRIFVKPERTGELEWKFWYNNVVDSTWDTGEFSHANMPGTSWKIRSASIAAADKHKNCSFHIPVLFNGQQSKEVAPAESFWSDAVTIDTSPEDYLVFTWCLELNENTVIPITPDSQAPCYFSNEECCDNLGLEKFTIANGAPIPNLFGARTGAEIFLAFIGDSITQGVGTENDQYEHWVPKIAKSLGDKTSVWNLGLGYGRGQDAASNGSWLSKAMHYNTVSICLGVNDILPHGGRSKEEILNDLSKIVDLLKTDPARKVILFTIPPFDFINDELKTWNLINDEICNVFVKKVDDIFDVRRVLSNPKPNDNITLYGPHPNGIGGTAIAEAFCEWYINNEKLK